MYQLTKPNPLFITKYTILNLRFIIPSSLPTERRVSLERVEEVGAEEVVWREEEEEWASSMDSRDNLSSVIVHSGTDVTEL